MNEDRHVGVVHLTPELLSELLGLPTGSRILGCRADEYGLLLLGVEHPSLPAVPQNVTPAAMLLVFADCETVSGTFEVERLSAAWSHDQDKRWPVSTRIKA
jgi:hypothetical protein